MPHLRTLSVPLVLATLLLPGCEEPDDPAVVLNFKVGSSHEVEGRTGFAPFSSTSSSWTRRTWGPGAWTGS